MKRLLQVLNLGAIAYVVFLLFSTPELRLYWAVALAALVLTQITLWTAFWLTGQTRQFKK